ncbi:hypothetical protein FFWV33_07845 [Flavobacterium faecale]|uniref:Glycosyltransferase 2-like domain-containing protein n=1 Tax=Flavobacterium faecale TaxID=1355330 RepID=A0A2S1LCL4_9FLAO|nr:glycosyltransferase family 2 protein [Flavobacterium faecale]AWG21451.1 hypothetical protein FFWV33_07845 [Flavobacterium faecale]
MEKKLSVIIPVYNAEQFIEKSIRSALDQPEVTEVIVVNDGSTDGTQAILTWMQNENPKVKVFQHPNYENKGRSATRNLGLQNATANYIAFLDADDYYLPNRFTNDFKVFQTNDQIDGVYNAVGLRFYNTVSHELRNEMKRQFTLTKKIEAKNLFCALLKGTYGYFHISGLTLKREVFEVIGAFNTKLVVSEDSDIFLRLALKCTLVASNINDSVAMRGIHSNNVFYRRDLYDENDLYFYESMYEWSSKNKINLNTVEKFLERIWILKYRKKEKKHKYLIYWFRLNLKAPKFLFSYLSVKYFPLTRFFKKKLYMVKSKINYLLLNSLNNK